MGPARIEWDRVGEGDLEAATKSGRLVSEMDLKIKHLK